MKLNTTKFRSFVQSVTNVELAPMMSLSSIGISPETTGVPGNSFLKVTVPNTISSEKKIPDLIQLAEKKLREEGFFEADDTLNKYKDENLRVVITGGNPKDKGIEEGLINTKKDGITTVYVNVRYFMRQYLLEDEYKGRPQDMYNLTKEEKEQRATEKDRKLAEKAPARLAHNYKGDVVANLETQIEEYSNHAETLKAKVRRENRKYNELRKEITELENRLYLNGVDDKTKELFENKRSSSSKRSRSQIKGECPSELEERSVQETLTKLREKIQEKEQQISDLRQEYVKCKKRVSKKEKELLQLQNELNQRAPLANASTATTTTSVDSYSDVEATGNFGSLADTSMDDITLPSRQNAVADLHTTTTSVEATGNSGLLDTPMSDVRSQQEASEPSGQKEAVADLHTTTTSVDSYSDVEATGNFGSLADTSMDDITLPSRQNAVADLHTTTTSVEATGNSGLLDTPMSDVRSQQEASEPSGQKEAVADLHTTTTSVEVTGNSGLLDTPMSDVSPQQEASGSRKRKRKRKPDSSAAEPRAKRPRINDEKSLVRINDKKSFKTMYSTLGYLRKEKLLESSSHKTSESGSHALNLTAERDNKKLQGFLNEVNAM